MHYFSALLAPAFLLACLIAPILSKEAPNPGLDHYYPPLPLPVTILHQFPAGTWLESLAVRKNGKILTTALSSPEIFQVDNHGVKPIKLVHTFANHTGCTGITKMGRDVFYVIAGNFSVSTFDVVPGSWAVYRVDVRHHHRHTTKPKPARVSLVAKFPDSVLLNGITVLHPYKKWLLISDSGAGVVYRLEAKTGKVIKVLDDPLMKSGGGSSIGINGLKVLGDNELYFTNSYKKILGRIIIDVDGASREVATVIAHVDGVDDFIFNGYKNVVAAQNGVDRIGRVTGNTVVTLAGGPANGTRSRIYGPTAIEFGALKPFFSVRKADWMKAYISTNGGTAQYLAGNVTRGGTISIVDIRGYW